MKSKIKARFVNTIIICFITLLTFICLAPVIHIVALSFSSNTAIFSSKVSFFPVDFNLNSYQSILSDQAMIHSLVYTIGLTILAASISMFLSVCGAYALSKKRLKGRAFFMILIIITMYFAGGIVPDYILVKDLGILNTIWALVLPLSVSAYNLIILKSFFQEIPDSFEESAYIDGANDIQILLRIVLPLSAPVLATISLFYAVGRWNYFQDVLFYISNKALYTLQMKLYQVIVNYEGLNVSAIEGITGNSLPESIRAAVIVFATVPILLVYPKLQRYFIKGVMIGGIKG